MLLFRTFWIDFNFLLGITLNLFLLVCTVLCCIRIVQEYNKHKLMAKYKRSVHGEQPHILCWEDIHGKKWWELIIVENIMQQTKSWGVVIEVNIIQQKIDELAKSGIVKENSISLSKII